MIGKRREGGPVARLLILLVRAYRAVPKSPVPRCRFVPSCSAYAMEALQRHGAVRGGLLALRRVGRCHPFHEGGIDPVPGSEDHPAGAPVGVARGEGAAA